MDSCFGDKKVNCSCCGSSNDENHTSLPQCIDKQNMWYKAKDIEEETFFFRLLWSDAQESTETVVKSDEQHPVDPFLFLDTLKEMLQTVLLAKHETQSITEDQNVNVYRTASRVYSTLTVQVYLLNDAEDCIEESLNTTGSASIRKALDDDDMILEDEWTVLMLIMTTKRWDLVEWFLSFHSKYAMHFLLRHRNAGIQSIPACHSPSGEDVEMFHHNTRCNGEEQSENSNLTALVLSNAAFSSCHCTCAKYPLLFLLSSSPPVSSPEGEDVHMEDSSMATYRLRIPVTSILQALTPLVRFCMLKYKKTQFTPNANQKENELTTLVMAMKQYFCSPPCDSSFGGDLVIGAENILKLLEDLCLPQYLWNQILEDDFHGFLLPVCETCPPDISSEAIDSLSLFLPILPQNVQQNYRMSMWLYTRIQRTRKREDSSLLDRGSSKKKIDLSTSASIEKCGSLTKFPTSLSHDEVEKEYPNSSGYFSFLLEPLVIVSSGHPFSCNFFSFSTSMTTSHDFHWMMDNFFSFSHTQANILFRSQIHLVELVVLSVLLSSATLQAKEIPPTGIPSASDSWRNFLDTSFFPSLTFLSSCERSASIGKTKMPETRRSSHSSGGVTEENTSAFTGVKEKHDREGSTRDENFHRDCRFLFSMVHTVLLSVAVGVGEVFRFQNLPVSPTSVVVHENDTHFCSRAVLESCQWVYTVTENIRSLLDWLGNIAEPVALSLHSLPDEKRSCTRDVTCVRGFLPRRTIGTAFYRYLLEIPLNYNECFSELWLGSISWKEGDGCRKFQYRVELFYFGLMESIFLAAEEREKDAKEGLNATEEKGVMEGEGETVSLSLLNRKAWWDALIHWVMYWKSFLILLHNENVLHLPPSFLVKDFPSSMHAEEECVLQQNEKRRMHVDEDSENNSRDSQDDFFTAEEEIQPVLESLAEKLEERMEYGSPPLPALYHKIIATDEPAPKERELSANLLDHDHLHSLLRTTCAASLEDSFKKAKQGFARRVDQVSDPTKLCFYGLYKQATEGDINIEIPWVLDRVGRAKWNAWNQWKGLTNEDAMTKYVDAYQKILKDAL